MDMKVVLQIKGRNLELSEQELIKIIEDYLDMQQTVLIGEWFEVKPQHINQDIFKHERVDKTQERTRKHILEALEEMNKHPEQYGKNFKIMIPRKFWESKTVKELKEIANALGERTADFTEQCLEWAQRLSNGEPWEVLCNKPDTIKWFRMVEDRSVFKMMGGAIVEYHSAVKLIGGSTECGFSTPACDVSKARKDDYLTAYTVPLIVKHE